MGGRRWPGKAPAVRRPERVVRSLTDLVVGDRPRGEHRSNGLAGGDHRVWVAVKPGGIDCWKLAKRRLVVGQEDMIIDIA